MKTFTAAMTASELKIKGELALDRLKDLEGALSYAAFYMPGSIIDRRELIILHDEIKTIAKMLNSLYDQVASNEKSSGAPRDS